MRDVEDAVRDLIEDDFKPGMLGLRSHEQEEEQDEEEEEDEMWDEKVWARVVRRARRSACGVKVKVSVVWEFD